MKSKLHMEVSSLALLLVLVHKAFGFGGKGVSYLPFPVYGVGAAFTQLLIS